MAVLLAQIFLGISLAGILILTFRKIPVLSRIGSEGMVVEEDAVSKAKNGIAGQLKRLSFYIFLENILFQLKSLILKLEEKITGWSEKVKNKNVKDEKYRDSYWDQLKRK
jgi:hypothetical protein